MTNVLQDAFARIAEVPEEKVCEALRDLAHTINSLDVRGCIDAWTWLALQSTGSDAPLLIVVRDQLFTHILAVHEKADNIKEFYGNHQDVHRLGLIIASVRQRQAS